MVVRASAVCVHNNALLLVLQHFPGMGTIWSLPGGKVEENETLAAAAIRETLEETGITVSASRLLYLTQRITSKQHIVQVLFECSYVTGQVGVGQLLTPTENVQDIRFVPLKDLESYGITRIFAERIRNEYPDAGSYIDNIRDLGI